MTEALPSGSPLATVQEIPSGMGAGRILHMAALEKPYKGLESFQTADADLFFGRDREAEQLIAKILCSRLTVLHAQSGAGKTSLLNARIIPGLEGRGWAAVREIPQSDPLRAVQIATVLHLLPPPEAERIALAQAWEQLDAPETIGELLRRHDSPGRSGGLDDRAPGDRELRREHRALRRRLSAPVAIRMRTPWTDEANDVVTTPWFCRLLRSTITVEHFAAHLQALSKIAGRALGADAQVTADTTVRSIFQTLTELWGSYPDALHAAFSGDRDLRAFFSNLLHLYGTRPDFGIVILFDQAEELFTRFVDQRSRGIPGPSWRLKWEFFEQLERLLGAPVAPDPKDGPLPVRFVISLRSEFLAQLDPIRSFAWDLDSCSYHLGLLSKRDAKTAITSPADIFGYGYTKECYETIVNELAREERFVEPAHIQIVCEKLWNTQGSALLTGSHATAEGPLDEDHDTTADGPLLGLGALTGLGGTQTILQSYFFEFLDSRPEYRLDTLELLEPLVTFSGTRNVVSRAELAEVRFRNAAHRDLLLQRLIRHGIVREERRLGGLFIEITHEFLVDPILASLKDLSSNADHARFRWALGTLGQLAQTGQDPHVIAPLRIGEFLALHDNRAKFEVDDWVRELMLRTALSVRDALPALRQPDEILRIWTRSLAHVHEPPPSIAAVAAALARDRLLTLGELEVLNEHRQHQSLGRLGFEQLRTIVRSHLLTSTDAERERVVYWTRRMAET
jgi:hypothetical protein